MQFRIRRLSDRGTSTPAVARTILQGSQLLEFFHVSGDIKQAAKEVLFDLQRHLVSCTEIADAVGSHLREADAKIAKDGFDTQADGRAVTLPSIPDLQTHAESFLQTAKLAIACTARLVVPFYGGKHDHRYNKLANWAATEFGDDDGLASVARGWEPWVKQVVEMRNAVDHPTDEPGGRLETQNYDIDADHDPPRLVHPRWGLSGGELSFLLPDMDAVIEGTLSLSEDVLAALFRKHIGDMPLDVYSIPEDERDAVCPIRLRVGFKEGFGPGVPEP